jgi:hypothetical protein
VGDDKLNAIMMDYRSQIIDLIQICEDMQGDVNVLLATYDITDEFQGYNMSKPAESRETPAENLVTPLS